MLSYEKLLLKKELEALDKLIHFLKQYLKDNLIEVKIFGSKVHGSAGDESDLDIYILANEIDYNIIHNISGFVAELNLEFNTNISPVVFSLEEDKKNRYFGTLFIKLLDKDGIKIYGAKKERAGKV
jgi:predicted nucleotidyltransferase